jgi:hypothetical protein
MTRQDLFIGIDVDGATGAAGEIGHMTVLPWGPYCRRGNRGCRKPWPQAQPSRVMAGSRCGGAYPPSSLSWLQATPSGSQPS